MTYIKTNTNIDNYWRYYAPMLPLHLRETKIFQHEEICEENRVKRKLIVCLFISLINLKYLQYSCTDLLDSPNK